MVPDKDTARRRRQARNRQERLNRQTRVEGAKRSEASTRPSRTADSPPTKTARSGSRSASSSSQSTTTGSGGFLDKLFPPRAAPAPQGKDGRPARRQPVRSTVIEVEGASGVRGVIVRMAAQPGGRATMFAAAVSLASAVLVLFFPIAPRAVLEYYGATVVEASHPDNDVVARRLESFADADPVFTSDLLINFANPVTVVIVTLIPLAIAGFALNGLTKPTRSRTLLIAAGVAALYSLFGSIAIFLLAAIALGFAAYQSRKADALVAVEVTDDSE